MIQRWMLDATARVSESGRGSLNSVLSITAWAWIAWPRPTGSPQWWSISR